ncbi:UPF0184 protein C9orf16 homolog [Polyodon spathula]|uniref:UPF0184 protein C9orf16 homolog n=1 Tax=Polyodon spathula TaxID=7913 RepID=UPI001B7F4227|nr:UPF0184 protein C9orf16 homolog [Polyodon spathula]
MVIGGIVDYDSTTCTALTFQTLTVKAAVLAERLLLHLKNMSGPNGDPNVSIGVDEEEEFSEEEYAAINAMLDQINSCLDDLEERNDSLNTKLKELLESNRQARQEFRQQLNEGLAQTPPSPPPPSSEQGGREEH